MIPPLATYGTLIGALFVSLSIGMGLSVSARPLTDQAARSPGIVRELDKNTGIFKGVITVNGTLPELEALVKKDDSKVKDAEVCAAETIPDESVVVGKGGGLANVFVYLAKAPEGYKTTRPTPILVFDQKGCRFKPHCLTVQTGQTVLVKSNDPIAHNTRTCPFRATPFNKAIKAGDRMGVPLVFDRAEKIPTIVKCDLHPWMRAYMLALDHPFMALTDENGAFAISGLPAGPHGFTFWQETVGYLQHTDSVVVVIEAGRTTEVNVSVPAEDLSIPE